MTDKKESKGAGVSANTPPKQGATKDSGLTDNTTKIIRVVDRIDEISFDLTCPHCGKTYTVIARLKLE